MRDEMQKLATKLCNEDSVYTGAEVAEMLRGLLVGRTATGVHRAAIQATSQSAGRSGGEAVH